MSKQHKSRDRKRLTHRDTHTHTPMGRQKKSKEIIGNSIGRRRRVRYIDIYREIDMYIGNVIPRNMFGWKAHSRTLGFPEAKENEMSF